MLLRIHLIAPVLALSLLCGRADAAPASQPSTTEFMRYVENPDGSARLEVADIAYRNAGGVVIHLIGAVHIADAEFFDGLNESFRRYDALLYEMVKPRDAPAPRRGAPTAGASGSWIGTMQRIMKDRLKLSYQLDRIDYRARNFIHADLDWETFNQLQDERGESFLTLAIRAAAHDFAKSAAGTSTGGDIDGFALLAALMSPDSSRQLKLLLARQFANIDDEIAAIEGPRGSVILAERNKKAFAVLQNQLSRGKRYMGIFYGAGHLKLMEKMLLDMGYKKVDTAWRTAWDIAPSPQPTSKPSR